ncbi:MAG: ATP-dependent metallopeptidase FtsH/Yme1/Tma family protein [Deltaproteobacteria bacterium]|nr:ATP-dependent metallopeptidase FtsH/Yme1/Tma family protein [Deltaproteobacteria bacterium]
MRRFSGTTLLWFAIIIAMMAVVLVVPANMGASKEVDFSTFQERLDRGEVKEVQVSGQEIKGKWTDDTAFRTVGPTNNESLSNALVERNVAFSFAEQEDTGLWINAILFLLPSAIMAGFFFWFIRNVQGSNGRAMAFGKSKARLLTESSRRVTFADVAGIEEAKEELSEIVDFLKDPRKFTRLGGRIPKGVLLMGSPGTGKTLLARAVAGEAGVPFFSISGSDFVEMFVGVGASRVRDLFEQGKKQAPCIILIDEIDAVGRHRGAGLGGGHDEREQTLNALLVEMDGFESTEGVILVAATNRPDVLDPALLRPGRFDRRVVVPNPDVRGREKILGIHSRKLQVAENVDLAVVAKGTPGFSGADLENLCNEAALSAARKDKGLVEMADFLEAREKIVMGPERRSMVIPEWERKNTAYHEAGHALVAFLLPGHDPVHKITIIPRGRALGSTWTMPDEDQLSMTRGGIVKRIAMLMGGRAAEEVAMRTITGGAANDIERATRLARHMVCDLGMSENLGPVTWGDNQQEVFIGRQMGTRVQTYSENTAHTIDVEVRGIVTRAYELAKAILTNNIHVLHQIAQTLIERESLDGDEFKRLVEQAGPIAPGEPALQWVGA